MIDLNFKYPEQSEHKEEYQKKLENVKSEKDLKGEDIKGILFTHFKDMQLLLKTERSEGGRYCNPFDFIVGCERTLDLVGIEIKGDTDNYSRLSEQLHAYSWSFDEVYLIVHKKKIVEWLPDWLGILRVFEDGSIYQEHHGYITDPLQVSTHFDWDGLFKENNLGVSPGHLKGTLKIIEDVRKNILFNRFFAVQKEWGSKEFSKFYPFTDEQKQTMMGFDVPNQLKVLKREVNQLEKRFHMIRNITKNI